MNPATGPINVIIKCPTIAPQERGVLCKAIREASPIALENGTSQGLVEAARMEFAIIRCDGAVAAADFINLVRGMGFEAKLYRGVQ